MVLHHQLRHSPTLFILGTLVLILAPLDAQTTPAAGEKEGQKRLEELLAPVHESIVITATPLAPVIDFRIKPPNPPSPLRGMRWSHKKPLRSFCRCATFITDYYKSIVNC